MFGRRRSRSFGSRGSYGGYSNGYPEYVTVAEKKARNDRAATALHKKNPNVSPIVVTGRKLARTWWGIAWNSNLERYADYGNRLDRGKSYLRNGAVLDLQIQAGTVTALVQGSARAPYQVTVTVEPLKKADWDRIREACAAELSSLQALLSGKFPEALKEMLMVRGKGLFPSPREIQIRCSCPDYATLCKHAAAVLYGIGARLDEHPELFFTLRGRSMEDLVQKAVQSQVAALAGKAEKAGQSSRRALSVMPAAFADLEIGQTVGAGVEPEPAPTEAPKRRGRPPKALSVPAPLPEPVVPEAPKRRGRPPKR